MQTPLPLAEALLVGAVGLLALALVSGVIVFMVHASLAVALAWQLVGTAAKS